MIINLWVESNRRRDLINLEGLVGMNYESGQLHIGLHGGELIYVLKQDTPAEQVWAAIKQALATLYDPRSMSVFAVQTYLDLRPFQETEVPF
jgi:hypothetical protein